VGQFIIALLEIYCPKSVVKNIENWLAFGKAGVKNIVAPFLPDMVWISK